jgi:hypothetical protein
VPVTIAGTQYLSFLDSAFPLPAAPVTDGAAAYIGGDAVHVWTPAEVQAVKSRYVLPVFVRDDPLKASAAGDVEEAVTALERLGCPPGRLVDWDSETSQDPVYIGAVSFLLGHAGYRLIDYGSRSFVTGNKNPDGWYWSADWTGSPHMDPEAQMTQYASTQAYDLSLCRMDLATWLWDRHPPQDSWTYAAPGGLEPYDVSRTGYRVRWEAVPAPASRPAPASYTVATYNAMGHLADYQVTNTVSALEYGQGGTGLGRGSYRTSVWANGAPAGPPHSSVIVTLAGK